MFVCVLCLTAFATGCRRDGVRESPTRPVPRTSCLVKADEEEEAGSDEEEEQKQKQKPFCEPTGWRKRRRMKFIVIKYSVQVIFFLCAGWGGVAGEGVSVSESSARI